MQLATQSLFSSGICSVLLVLLNSCNHPPSSLAADPDRSLLSLAEPPVKMVTDTVHHRVYWLSFVGEVYRSLPDGSQRERVVRGVGTNRVATFVEDFCLDQLRQCLFFTDLWDQTTGQSAIKKMDMANGKITTVVLLGQETPYRLQLDTAANELYYFTKSENMRGKTYRLRMLGRERSLAVSSQKMKNIAGWITEYQKSPPSLAQSEPLARK